MKSPREIAREMGEAEKRGDKNALECYLHKDLIFRRADGSIVNKEEFLKGVKERPRVDLEILEDEAIEEDRAAGSIVVTLIIRTRDGSFRNVRVFVRDYGAWRCKLWVNTKLETPLPLRVETLHHVSLPVTDLERSMSFYKNVLCLGESRMRRPDPPRFNFKGAWYQVGAGQLHLILRERTIDQQEGRPPPTYRTGKSVDWERVDCKGVDSRDIHFAVRVHSFAAAEQHLKGMDYTEDTQDDFKRMRVNRHESNQGAGFPQIYILDPDCHVIEINAERLDEDKPPSEQEGKPHAAQ